jgi:8-oxo-dGTP pyrophosphatase MutT (NUDIX family)
MIKGSDTIDTAENTIFTANAVIFRNASHGREFLIVQENDGQWGLAGGAKDLDDQDITATLKREIQEELSLLPSYYKFSLAKSRVEFVYDHRSSTRFGKKGVIIFFIVKISSPEKIKKQAELKSFAWVSGTEALDRLSFKEVKGGFRKVVDEIEERY